MNTIIKQGIDQATETLTYWGLEREKVERHNANSIDTNHELSLVNVDSAIKAAEAQLDDQFRIAKELLAKNELLHTDVVDYLAFLKRAVAALIELYNQYPNPVLKVIIATLEKVIALVEKIIGLFA